MRLYTRWFFLYGIYKTSCCIHIHVVFRYVEQAKKQMRIVFVISYSLAMIESIKAAVSLFPITFAANRFVFYVFFSS